jgi:archaellum component FlaC
MDIQLLLDIKSELSFIKKEISEMKETCKRLENHIDFVENTYNGLRTPLEYIKSYFSYDTIEQP